MIDHITARTLILCAALLAALAPAGSHARTPTGDQATPAGSQATSADTIVRGRLDASDPVLTSGRYVDGYRLAVREGDKVSAILRAEGFNAYLVVGGSDEFGVDLETVYLHHEDITDWAVSVRDHTARADGFVFIMVTSRQQGVSGGEQGTYRLEVAHTTTDRRPAETVQQLADAWITDLIAAQAMDRAAWGGGETAQAAAQFTRAAEAYEALGMSARASLMHVKAGMIHSSLGATADAQASERAAQALPCVVACDADYAAPKQPISGVSGRLESGDAVFPGRGFVDAYDAQLVAGERVTASLHTTDIFGQLLLVSPSGEIVVDQDGAQLTTIDHQVAEDGVWRILVTTHLEDLDGSYRLAVNTHSDAAASSSEPVLPRSAAEAVPTREVADWLAARVLAEQARGRSGGDAAALDARAADPRASVAPVDADGTISGILAADAPAFASGRRLQAYEFDAAPSGHAEITLETDGFEGRVWLYSPSGALMDDDVAVTVAGRAQLVRDLSEGGPWMVLVTPVETTGTGTFTLHVDASRSGRSAGTELRALTPSQLRAFADAQRLRQLIVDAGMSREAAELDEQLAEKLQAAGRTREAFWALIRGSRMYRRVSRPVDAQRLIALAGIVQAAEDETFAWSSYFLSLGAADLHLDEGRALSAIVLYRMAHDAAQAQGSAAGVAEALYGVGAVHARLGRAELARDHFARALELIRTRNAPAIEASVRHGLGSVLVDLGQADSALVQLERAMDLRLTTGDSLGVAETASKIGHVHAQQGRHGRALEQFRRALVLQRSVGSRAGEGTALSAIGVAQFGLGRTDSAHIYLGEALRLQRQGNDAPGEAATLAAAGRLHHDTGTDLDRAVAYYDSAWSVFATLRDRSGTDANRISFGEVMNSLSGRWVKAWLEREAEVGARHSRLAALGAVERGRAQSLLELMQGTRDVQPGGDLAREAETILDQVNGLGTAALSYALSSDTLFVWLSTPDGGLEVFRKAIADSALASRIATLRARLDVDSAAVRSGGVQTEPDGPMIRARRGAGGYAELLSELAATVLPQQLAQKLPEGADLVIIPQGPLALLPFAALPVGDGVLGVRNRIRYAPSLATLVQAEALPASAAGARSTALVAGNPEMPSVAGADGTIRQLGSLPGALREGTAVARLLDATLITGTDAGEAAVRERMSTAPVVHLATHGYAYGTEALARESYIALAPGAGEDGLLTVGEILDSAGRMSADLVVLSACQTGLGDRKLAEGTVGLQWAFLAKGTRTVLVSLWSVDDAVTQKLMTAFYTHWSTGVDKAEALRRAQEDVMREHPNPRYWAAFQLVGAR